MINDSELRDRIRDLYLEYLEREPSNSEIEYYLRQIFEQKNELADLHLIFKNSEEHKLLIKTKNEKEERTKDIVAILNNQSINEFENKFEEPENIFVSCFNEKTDEGGIYQLDNYKLKPIFTKSACYGMYFDKKNKILYGVIRKEPQIIALKIEHGEIFQIPISFSKYIFANDVHGITVLNDKIVIVATNGHINGELAININTNQKDKIGKIIISNLRYKNQKIFISNSKIINPFQCNHHHHINDILENNGKFYISCHSHCNQNKELIETGAIIKTDFSNKETIINKIEHPHSIKLFNNRIYFCASNYASLFSFELERNTIRLEYKCIDAYMRGLLISKMFFYIGYSVSFGRTNSKFNNATSGIIIVNKRTGESRKINLPSNCDNIYEITSD